VPLTCLLLAVPFGVALGSSVAKLCARVKQNFAYFVRQTDKTKPVRGGLFDLWVRYRVCG